MALELCEEQEYAERNGQKEPWYQEREGNLLTGVRALRERGRNAGNTAVVLERRMHSEKKDWQTNYFDSPDLLAYHPDGRIKLVYDGLLCADLFSQLELYDGLLNGDEELYEVLPSKEFRRRDLKLNEDLLKEEAKEHELWNALARDESLLGEYVERFHPQGKMKAMGVYLLSPPLSGITLGASFVCRLGGGSQFFGGVVSATVGRVVGSTPEASAALTAKYPYLASREQEVRGTLERYFARRGRSGSLIGSRKVSRPRK